MAREKFLKKLPLPKLSGCVSYDTATACRQLGDHLSGGHGLRRVRSKGALDALRELGAPRRATLHQLAEADDGGGEVRPRAARHLTWRVKR